MKLVAIILNNAIQEILASDDIEIKKLAALRWFERNATETLREMQNDPSSTKPTSGEKYDFVNSVLKELEPKQNHVVVMDGRVYIATYVGPEEENIIRPSREDQQ